MSLEILSTQKSFGGWHKRVRHHSNVLDCDMVFAVYLPPQAEQPGARLPVLYWLSGLTCTDENFMQKAPLVRAFEVRPGQQRPRVDRIAQDSRGLIWAASDAGLLRTDGETVEVMARFENERIAAIGGTAPGSSPRFRAERCSAAVMRAATPCSSSRCSAVPA